MTSIEVGRFTVEESLEGDSIALWIVFDEHRRSRAFLSTKDKAMKWAEENQ